MKLCGIIFFVLKYIYKKSWANVAPCALCVAKIREKHHFIHPFSNFFCQALFEMRNLHYFFKKPNQPNLTVVGFLFCMLTTFCSCWEVLHVQFYYLSVSWVNNSCASVTHLQQSKAASELITPVEREELCCGCVVSCTCIISERQVRYWLLK